MTSSESAPEATAAPAGQNHDWPIRPQSVTLAIEGWNAAALERRDLFVQALESLRTQSYPVLECEILVIVDADAGGDIAWIEDILPGARVLGLAGFTYYRCKNLAMARARGHYLVHADSDVRYAPDWFANMLQAFGPDTDIVAGRTRYEPGRFSRTMAVCDGGMVRSESGPTDGFFSHNVAMRERVYRQVSFDETLGRSGGGAVERLRDQLRARGTRTWFCAEANAEHHYPGFFRTRLRLGAYRFRTLHMNSQMQGAWLARVPLLGPILVTGAALAKAWARAWRTRTALPGGVAGFPAFVIAIACVESLDLLGACAYAWAPGILTRRVDWFDVPPRTSPPGP